MKINEADQTIRKTLLTETTASSVRNIVENATQDKNSKTNIVEEDSVNVGLSQYINENLSAESIVAEREEKIKKLKELYDKGEYKGAEAQELAKSFIESINDEVLEARNLYLFGDDI